MQLKPCEQSRDADADHCKIIMVSEQLDIFDQNLLDHWTHIEKPYQLLVLCNDVTFDKEATT